MGHYTLDGHTPVLASDYGPFPTDKERRVAETCFTAGGIPFRVSTVFLAIDHNFSGIGPPVLFETMTFADMPDVPADVKSELDELQYRYCTWEAAEQGHTAMLARVCEFMEAR